MRPWTLEDEEFLINNYSNMTAANVAIKMGRSEKSIYKKAYSLITKGRSTKKKDLSRSRDWTPEEDQYLIDNILIKSIGEIADLLKRSKQSVAQRFPKLGISRSDRFKKISPGDIFGKITILEKIGSTGKREGLYSAKCECGNIFTVIRGGLLNGHAKSCGCSNTTINLKPPGLAGFKSDFISCRGGAKSRNIDFKLTLEDFILIARKPCNWCGEPPRRKNPYVNSVGKPKRGNIKTSTVERAWYSANGIDRIDSDLGYVIENCVPCCAHCNVIKMDYSVEQFVSHCIKIVDFQKNKK